MDIVSNYTEYSCAVRSTCTLDPNSTVCQALRDGDPHTASYLPKSELDKSTGEQAVYVCNTSNAEVVQDECSSISPRECIASSLIPGCHLRFLSAPTLARYPRVLIGDTTVLPKVVDQESSASKAFSLGCYILSIIGIGLAILA